MVCVGVVVVVYEKIKCKMVQACHLAVAFVVPVLQSVKSVKVHHYCITLQPTLKVASSSYLCKVVQLQANMQSKITHCILNS